MAPTIERESGSGPYRFLAQTVTAGQEARKTLFVHCPELKQTNFHTYGAGDGMSPDYYKPVPEFDRKEYLTLVYEESRFTNGTFVLERVEDAQLTEPCPAQTIADSAIPATCPVCGRQATAVLLESDTGTYTDRVFDTNADSVCVPSAVRCRWLDIHEDSVFVH
jgi:hypothetical protein